MSWLENSVTSAGLSVDHYQRVVEPSLPVPRPDHPKVKGTGVATVDVITLAIIGVFGVIGLVLVLIPGLSDAAIRAVRSVRELRQEISGESAKEPSQGREKEEQRQL